MSGGRVSLAKETCIERFWADVQGFEGLRADSLRSELARFCGDATRARKQPRSNRKGLNLLSTCKHLHGTLRQRMLLVYTGGAIWATRPASHMSEKLV